MKKIYLFLLVLLAIELTVIIKVGSAVGALATLALLCVSALIGVVIVKSGARQILELMRDGRMPDTRFIWVPLAGFLFIFPGFCSDLLALLLLVPQIRGQLERRTAARRPGFDGRTPGFGRTARPEGRVIEGRATVEGEDDDGESRTRDDRPRGA